MNGVPATLVSPMVHGRCVLPHFIDVGAVVYWFSVTLHEHPGLLFSAFPYRFTYPR